jgi:hypothetical protein
VTSLAAASFFFGYLLVYAAVANHGAFAEHPWDALRADAYGQDVKNVNAAGGAGGFIGKVVKPALQDGLSALNPALGKVLGR